MSNPLRAKNPDGSTKPVLPVHVLALTYEEAVNEGMGLLSQKRKENPDHFVQVHIYLPQTMGKLFGLRGVEFYAVGRLMEIMRFVNEARIRGTIFPFWNAGT